MLKVPSSVEAESLLKVRCPPHTPEKFYQFFTIELQQTTGISQPSHVSGHDALLTVEGTCWTACQVLEMSSRTCRQPFAKRLSHTSWALERKAVEQDYHRARTWALPYLGHVCSSKVIDCCHSTVDFRGNSISSSLVFRENSTAKPKIAIIGQINSLLVSLKLHYWNDWAKYLHTK